MVYPLCLKEVNSRSQTQVIYIMCGGSVGQAVKEKIAK